MVKPEFVPLGEFVSNVVNIFMEQSNLENDGGSFFGGGAS